MKIKVKLNSRRNEYGDFCVGWYEDNVKNEDKSYYTDDFADAIGTEELMKIEAALEESKVFWPELLEKLNEAKERTNYDFKSSHNVATLKQLQELHNSINSTIICIQHIYAK